MRYVRSILAIVSTVLLLTAQAGAAANASRSSLCLMLESAARANGLPTAFLVRVIWRESRFDPMAIGPRTRSGAHAQGIAQFMASTAAERALTNPFDPVQALPKAAEFLRDLRDEFGNLGLAAAAYNAGPGRVRGWLYGGRTLPDETQRYVEAITGRSPADWAKAGTVSMIAPEVDCLELVTSLEQGPSRFFYELEERITAAIGQPWGVELVASFSRDRVLSTYSRLMEKLSGVIGEHDPIIAIAMLRSRGTSPMYQARIGADTRASANGICRKIQSAGVACLVLRNTKVKIQE
jgi:soluble lytic murein transglycosylase-like protein